MGSNKRAWELQEFVAHSADVTCLAIGPASGRVMVTGGLDKKVNMWAIGKPNVILSLSGHNSPIECVQFNGTEELVCAGSQSGTLKIWDLEAAKIVRTLTGHKANVRSLDFHPYGEFVASGSNDTTVKLWDVRRKGCIVSYKGHTNGINHLRFSPDGRWVMSAGEDGLVKLWDLNAGKLLADFILHTGPVNRVEFHPREFLVATGSSDRTVKFWDLETFGLVSSTEVEASAVRTIGFHPEGSCLFSGGDNSLRAYSWEPSYCYDAQTLGWGKVADMAFSSNQLIGASYHAPNVSVWVVNMNGLEETITKAQKEQYVGRVEINQSVQPTDQQYVNQKKNSPQRKSFTTRPKTSSSKTKKSAAKEENLDNFNKAVEEKLSNPTTGYENVFQPKTALGRSPESQRKNSIQNNDKQSKNIANEQEMAHPAQAVEEHIPPATATTIPFSKPIFNQPSKPLYHPPSLNNQPFQQPKTAHNSPPPRTASSRVTQQQQQPSPVHHYHEPVQTPVQPVAYHEPQQAVNNFPVQHKQQPRSAAPARRQQSVEDKMKGMNLNEFSKVAPPTHHVNTPDDEDSTLEILEKSHSSLCQIMQARLQNLSLVSRLWTEGDIKASVETASSMSDLSVFVDIMNVLILKQALWSLDLCGVIIPQLKSLFSSNYETYVETASSSLKLMLKNFSQLIKSTLSTPPGAIGVDLSREERYNKCEKCYKGLKDIRQLIVERAHTSGRIGTLCRELNIALNVID